eukprot:m.92431 g.92431  ORF g.92431 m.92431 type:complete len:336 (+) comp9957_c0_seq2:52-1059(+)
MQTMLVRSVRLGRSAATAAVATPIARARTVAASSYTPRINTFSCLGRTSHHVGAVQATSVGHAVCGGQHRSYASAAEATESSGGDAVNGGAPAVPEGVRPIRFIVPDKPVAASLSDVMAQLRGELAARAAVRSARNPGWTPHDQTVEAVFTVSTHDKNKKKGIPRDPFRGLVTLPHRFGPTKNIAVLASGDEADRAKEAGATTVGGTDILPDLARGKIAFDVLLATPEFLNATKKFGRDLGPKMPSVKRGTVGDDTAAMVRQHLGGRPYRMDKHGRVRVGLGKVSFSDEQLRENLAELLKAIDTHRLSPAGRFVLDVKLSTTQSRSCLPVHFERL